jgi:8-oxo-dGTP pyrophosphatase MutT (NUDIX family)
MVHLTDADGFAATLKAALDPHPVPTPGPDDRLAAVLALLILGDDPSLVFTVRASTLSRHAGEISFPGGLQDPGESLRETAVREAHEEIGLDPAEPLVLGALPPLHTVVSGILVVPFVGTLASLPDLVPSEAEIDEILVFSLEELARAERVVELDKPGGGIWRGFAYDVDGRTVWGATGWMVHALLDMIRRETSWGN